MAATTIATSTYADATGPSASPLVGFAPSDGSAIVLYHDGSAPKLATAQAPYTTWVTQTIGAATTRHFLGINVRADDSVDVVVASPSAGSYWFYFTRSGNVWSEANNGQIGIGNTVTSGNAVVGKLHVDPQNRYWWVQLDPATPTLVAGYAATPSGSWTSSLSQTGIQNFRGTPFSAIIGGYLVVVYGMTGGALAYRRIDVSGASLGTWSTGASISGISDSATAIQGDLIDLGGGMGMMVYSSANGIKAYLYDAATNTWTSSATLSGSATDLQPSLVPAGSGKCYALWSKVISGTNYALVSKAYDGTTWDASAATLEASAAGQTYAKAALHSGNLGLLWTANTASPFNVRFENVPAPTNPGPIVAQDSFIRANVASGWGTATNGVAWTQQQAGPTLSVSANAGVASGNAASRALLTLGSLSNKDGEVLFRFTSSTISAQSDVYALARFQDANNHYWLGYNWISSSSMQLAIRKRVGGANTTITSSVITVAANTFYWVRARVEGSTLSVKFWQDGTLEPTAWTLSTTDTALTTGTLWGLAPYTGNSTANLKVDSFSAFSLVGDGTPTQQDIIGSAQVTASANLNLTTAKKLFAVAAAEVQALSRLTVAKTISGGGTATTQASLSITVTRKLAGVFALSTNTSVAVTVARLIAGSAHLQADASLDLTISGDAKLYGTAHAQLLAQLALTVEKRLRGTAPLLVSSGLVLSTEKRHDIIGTGTIQVNASLALTRDVRLGGQAQAQTNASILLTVRKTISGSAPLTANGQMALTVVDMHYREPSGEVTLLATYTATVELSDEHTATVELLPGPEGTVE